jgi:hypothetical protein
MNFETNPLPHFVIAELYKNNLVEIEHNLPLEKAKTPENTSIQPTTLQEKPLQYLGENKKEITILVKEENAVHIGEENLQFLMTILAACKLNIADVAILNTQNQPTDFATLNKTLHCKYVLLFNINTQAINLPFSIPQYQIQHYNNCTFLIANSLQSMLGNSQEAKVEKSKLWVSLKTMFGV